jgi:hypothetical protein
MKPMANESKATVRLAIVAMCALGCLAIEAVAYALGWTKTLGESLLNWIAYSAVTSIVVIALTKRKRNKNDNP